MRLVFLICKKGTKEQRLKTEKFKGRISKITNYPFLFF